MGVSYKVKLGKLYNYDEQGTKEKLHCINKNQFEKSNLLCGYSLSRFNHDSIR